MFGANKKIGRVSIKSTVKYTINKNLKTNNKLLKAQNTRKSFLKTRN